MTNSSVGKKRGKGQSILGEILIIFLSAVTSLILPSSLIKFGVISSPALAYALMFFIYSQIYLLLKKYLLRISLAMKSFEFELVSGALTVYMLVLLPIMKDQPTIVQLPACYWTFIFISFYVSKRGSRRNKRALRVEDDQLGLIVQERQDEKKDSVEVDIDEL